MKLAETSRALLEEFLREHFNQADLSLPKISIYSGALAQFVTRAFKIEAITFGHSIWVAPAQLQRDDAGRIIIDGPLLAHEAAHVIQYQREGRARFLYNYLSSYFGTLRRQPKLGVAAHFKAYLEIGEEVEAREAEAAYRLWRARRIN